MPSGDPNNGPRYSPPPSPSVVMPPIQPSESVVEPSISSSKPMVMSPNTSSESEATEEPSTSTSKPMGTSTNTSGESDVMPPSLFSQPMATAPDPWVQPGRGQPGKARFKPDFQPLEIPPRPIYQPRMMSPTTHSRPVTMSPAQHPTTHSRPVMMLPVQHRQPMVMLPSPRSRMHSTPTSPASQQPVMMPTSPASQQPVMMPTQRSQPGITSPKLQCPPSEIPPRSNYRPGAISPTPHSYSSEMSPAAATHSQSLLTPEQQPAAMSPKPHSESPTPQLEAAAVLSPNPDCPSPTPQNQHVSHMTATQHRPMMVPYQPQHYHQHFMYPPSPYYQPGPVVPFNVPMIPAGFQAPNHLYPEHERAWSTDLFDCTKDIRNCTRTIFCPCVTFGQIADIVNEGTTPWYEPGLLCALLAAVKVVTFFSPCFCHPSFPYTGFYRTKLRKKYKLKGSTFEDYLVHCCCECCALCQEFRELDHQGFDVPLGWHENKRRERQAVAIFRFIPPEEQGMTR